MEYYNGKTKKQHLIDYIIDTTLLKIDNLVYQHVYIMSTCVTFCVSGLNIELDLYRFYCLPPAEAVGKRAM